MNFVPVTSWLLVTLLAAGALVALLAALKARRLGGRGRHPIVLLAAGTALAFILAALNPLLRAPDAPAGSHLVVAVDVSKSVQRAGNTWSEVRRTLHDAVAETVDGLGDEVRQTSTSTLLVFARGTNPIARDIRVSDLPRAVSRLSESDLPPADASDLEAGLEAAADALEDAGRGAILLVSDGHETRGDARRAARDLARRGFAVHVAALGGRSPEIGLYAADLPRQVEAGTATTARLLLANSAAGDLPLELAFRRARGEAVTRASTLPGTGWFNLRQPIFFDQAGLRFLDLELTAATGQQQSRRFYTYVAAPPRILVAGDDHRWTAALSPERFHVETVAPEAFDASYDLTRYDAVVLHEVVADRLPEGQLARLATAVVRSGIGAFVVNGPHPGKLDEPTILMSYDGTPLEALLPIINKPRPILSAPPPRHIVILIDTSGSMSGWRLEKSKQIAVAVVARLRGVDRLHLIAFTGGAHPLISAVPMTEGGKNQAYGIIGGLKSGGGTNPTEALQLIEKKGLENCGLFLISDGEFAIVNARPDCEPTLFAIDKTDATIPRALAEIAEPIAVPDDTFNPAAVRISFFNPKPRKNRFESGRFTPILGLDAFAGGWTLLPEPVIPLFGNAVTHGREDAELAVMRPRPRDPILAYRDSRVEHGMGGAVGALTTAIPATYYDSSPGARAVEGWIERLLAHAQRDRYTFHLEDRGDAVALEVSLLSRQGSVPRIHRLSVAVETLDGGVQVVPLRPDPELTGVFSGLLRLPRGPEPSEARLVLAENGPDALRRPQRIPLVIPPRQEARRIVGDEAWSFGLDADLLRDLAHLTGGRVLEPGGGQALVHGAGAPPASGSLWPWLVAAAIVLFLGQVAVRRVLS